MQKPFYVEKTMQNRIVAGIQRLLNNPKALTEFAATQRLTLEAARLLLEKGLHTPDIPAEVLAYLNHEQTPDDIKSYHAGEEKGYHRGHQVGVMQGAFFTLATTVVGVLWIWLKTRPSTKE